MAAIMVSKDSSHTGVLGIDFKCSYIGMKMPRIRGKYLVDFLLNNMSAMRIFTKSVSNQIGAHLQDFFLNHCHLSIWIFKTILYRRQANVLYVND